MKAASLPRFFLRCSAWSQISTKSSRYWHATLDSFLSMPIWEYSVSRSKNSPHFSSSAARAVEYALVSSPGLDHERKGIVAHACWREDLRGMVSVNPIVVSEPIRARVIYVQMHRRLRFRPRWRCTARSC